MSTEENQSFIESIAYLVLGFIFILVSIFVKFDSVIAIIILLLAATFSIFAGIVQLRKHFDSKKPQSSIEGKASSLHKKRTLSSTEIENGIRLYFSKMFIGGEDQIVDSVLESQNCEDASEIRKEIKSKLHEFAIEKGLKFNSVNRTYSEM